MSKAKELKKASSVNPVDIYYRGSSMYVDPRQALTRAVEVINNEVEKMKNDKAFKERLKRVQPIDEN